MDKVLLSIDVVNLYTPELRKYSECTVLNIILFLKNDLQFQTRCKSIEYKDTFKITSSLDIDFPIDWYVKAANPGLVTIAGQILNTNSQHQLNFFLYFLFEQVIKSEQKHRLFFNHSQ